MIKVGRHHICLCGKFSVYLYMKQCIRCGSDSNEFRKNSKRKDGLDNVCKVCRKNADKKCYITHIDSNRKSASKNKQKIRNRNREFILSYLNLNPCVDCGESDPVVLEFDHQKDKSENISKLIMNGSIASIKTEINKCEIRCANCHRRKTAKDFNYYRNKIVE